MDGYLKNNNDDDEEEEEVEDMISYASSPLGNSTISILTLFSSFPENINPARS